MKKNSLNISKPETIPQCLSPFIPCEGQGYNQTCVVFKEIIDRFIKNISAELFAFRVVIATTITSNLDNEEKFKLISELFSDDFMEYYSEILHSKQTKGIKKSFYPNGGWLFEADILKLAIILTLTNNAVYRDIVLRSLQLKSIYSSPKNISDSVQDNFSKAVYDISPSFINFSTLTETVLKDLFTCVGENIIFFKNSKQTVDFIYRFINCSSEDITDYICSEWKLTKPQIQIRQYDAQSANIHDDRFSFLENSFGELTVLQYLGDDSIVDIPATIAEKPVVYIFDFAFFPTSSEGDWNREKLQDYVTRNGKQKKERVYVESVRLPDSIREIGRKAFTNLQRLKTINIPEGVGWLPAFDGCSSLETVQMPSKAHGWLARPSGFHGCFRLECVEIPYGVTECPSFHDCKNLKAVRIPDTLEFVPSYSFAGCYKLEELYLPAERISKNVFDGCVNLRDLYLPYLRRSEAVNTGTKKLVLHGYEGSYTETFAIKHGIKFSPDMPQTKCKDNSREAEDKSKK